VSATVELLGPIIAGVLVAVLGTTTVLYIDAATFLVSALIIARLLPAMPSLLQAGGRYLDEVREGIAFLRSNQLLVTILMAALVLNFFAAPFGGVFLPVFASDQDWGARSLGFLFSGFGAGMILGSVMFGAIGVRFKRRTWLLAALIYLGVMMALLSVASILPVAVGLTVLSGIALGIINPVVGTVFLEQVPAELRGRVLGAMGALSMCASPLGMLVAGPTVQAIGVTAAFVIVGSVFVAVGFALATRPILHQMERGAVDAEPAST
jgi:MFS family permease